MSIETEKRREYVYICYTNTRREREMMRERDERER